MITPQCQILSIFSKVLVLIFRVWNFRVNANKSEYIKVKSSKKCLDLMHTKFHSSVAPASWSGSELTLVCKKEKNSKLRVLKLTMSYVNKMLNFQNIVKKNYCNFLLKPIALREARIAYNFGLSECSRVKKY